MSGPLEPDVAAFVDGLRSELAGLGGRSIAEADLSLEAADLVACVLASDGRLTDDELLAYLGAFAGRLGGSLERATPADLRAGSLFEGRSEWAAAPSSLLAVLAEADRTRRTSAAATYRRLGLALAYRTAALDRVPSPAELDSINRMRHTWERIVPPPRPEAPRETNGATGARAAEPVASSPAEPVRPLEEVLAELDALVGLAPVKREVRLLVDLLRVGHLRAERGLPVVETSHHLVFTGNPGTGKTTVARLLGQMYRSLEVVSRGQLVEVDRSRLVAGYIGQTAIRTREVIESAVGGVLLIDEAYALARGGDNDFGREAIDTLVKLMEDHRADLAVIAAGYPEEMTTFVEANPGLRSRFDRTVHFPDYTDDELVSIFDRLGAKQRYVPTPDALEEVRTTIAAVERGRGFGNARFVRNLFERTIAAHASRLVTIEAPTDEQLTTLEADDVRAAAER